MLPNNGYPQIMTQQDYKLTEPKLTTDTNVIVEENSIDNHGTVLNADEGTGPNSASRNSA